MGLDGNRMMKSLKHLSEVETMKQVKPLSYALFPGYHCPLMGAMLTIREIDGSVMLVVGPDECAFYTQLATSGGTMETSGCQIVSVPLDQHDVTFGSQEKMDEAFAELVEEYAPEAVFLVTTCVVEVTGDDMDAMAEGYSRQYDLPVLVVHAENFKTDDHLPGIEHTLDACFQLMELQPVRDLVNVLGLRLGDFRRTEVCRFLKESGVEVGMTLPGRTSVDALRTAPAARCNLVVHPVGLPLAQAMEKRFGTPYVLFERYSDPNRILSCYEQLYRILGRELPSALTEHWEESLARVEDAHAHLRGRTYFSGNTALCNWELHDFLANHLEVKPLLLQISDLDESGAAFRESLRNVCDPFVTRAANLAAIGVLYPLLRPDFNIGAGDTVALRKQRIAAVRMTGAYDVLGFETCDLVLDALLQADCEWKAMRGGAA